MDLFCGILGRVMEWELESVEWSGGRDPVNSLEWARDTFFLGFLLWANLKIKTTKCNKSYFPTLLPKFLFIKGQGKRKARSTLARYQITYPGPTSSLISS